MKKYVEIMEIMEREVDEGKLKPGSKLPSIRTLSEEFSCSKNTVIKAYQELENRHVIYSVPQSGYYVVKDHHLTHHAGAKETLIDFQSAGPDPNLMPYVDYKHCMNQAIDRYKEAMFSYSDIQGLYSLRQELARHLQDLQVFTKPERIFIVTGSQQALHLFNSLPFPNGKNNICVEQPTHPSMIQSLQFQHAKTIGIEIGKTGPDLNLLEEIFQKEDIKFFYTVSRFHNPTGYSYTNDKRRKIVELAKKYDVYIVEDDYMGDFDTNQKQDPMFAFDPSGRVIYTKSFSKVLLPGLRLGLAVLPEALKQRFMQGKFALDVHTPVITQGALEMYFKSGMYKAHIEKLSRLYKRKGTLLQQAYHEFLPVPTSFSGSTSGFYSMIELPHPLKASTLIDHLKADHVLLDSTERMWLPDFIRKNTLRLSVSQIEEAKIAVGVQKIGEGIRDLLRKRHKNRRPTR